VPRAIFAGLVGLMTVIPSGLEWIVWLLPQNFFTTQLVLATWWGEAPLLALATIVCFYWVGQCGGVVRNGLVSFAFALGCFLAVVAYPAGGVYFVPLMAVYCAVFLFTSAGRPEWAWKLIICAVVAAAALLLKVPQFFAYLYGYTFGSHFIDFMQAPPSALINDTFMVSVRGFEWRRVLIFFVSIATAVVMAARGPRPLRRFSLALLACEIAIVAGSLVNALFFRAPILFAYAEVAHSSLWAAYVVLFGMAIVVVLDQRLALLPAGSLVHELIARRRPAALAAVAVMMGAYALWAPRPSIIAYPPAKTPPVELLARELALAPGAPFRGRALTIFAPEGEDFYAIALRYRQALGSDFYEELLPFGIPTANESQHWTSPVTFAFLRRFFGHEGSEFDKNFFWLDRYNAKIARLIGVRMVVSDADVNEGAVVYEQRVGGRRLRIYRLDNTNLGQYSPTHLSRANSAAAAIAAMEADSFDPRQDAVVEDDMPGDLVAAGAVSVIVEAGPRLRVRARSPGRSLIVLPFEFSHCLHLHGPTSARILPVNLQQVALLFEKEADVSIDFQYGVFDSACRGADIARAKALDLRAIIRPPHT
jgi:hypothetical protein